MRYKDVIVEKLGSPRFNRLVNDTVAEIISEANRELQGTETSPRAMKTRITALRGKFAEKLDDELAKAVRRIEKKLLAIPRAKR